MNQDLPPMRVKVCTHSHWQLWCDHQGWMINLYPTTGTVFVNPKRMTQPPDEVVRAFLGDGTWHRSTDRVRNLAAEALEAM